MIERFIIYSLRLVFPLNKKGFIVPCTLTTKIVPNID